MDTTILYSILSKLIYFTSFFPVFVYAYILTNGGMKLEFSVDTITSSSLAAICFLLQVLTAAGGAAVLRLRNRESAVTKLVRKMVLSSSADYRDLRSMDFENLPEAIQGRVTLTTMTYGLALIQACFLFGLVFSLQLGNTTVFLGGVALGLIAYVAGYPTKKKPTYGAQ